MNTKIELNDTELLIIKHLYKKQDGEELFYFHKQYKIPPDIIFSFVEKFTKEEYLLRISKKRVKLSNKGKEWILSNKKYIYLTQRLKKWRRLPSKMLIQPYDGFYIPDENKIDKSYFNKLIN